MIGREVVPSGYKHDSRNATLAPSVCHYTCDLSHSNRIASLCYSMYSYLNGLILKIVHITDKIYPTFRILCSGLMCVQTWL